MLSGSLAGQHKRGRLGLSKTGGEESHEVLFKSSTRPMFAAAAAATAASVIGFDAGAEWFGDLGLWISGLGGG